MQIAHQQKLYDKISGTAEVSHHQQHFRQYFYVYCFSTIINARDATINARDIMINAWERQHQRQETPSSTTRNIIIIAWTSYHELLRTSSYAQQRYHQRLGTPTLFGNGVINAWERHRQHQGMPSSKPGNAINNARASHHQRLGPP